MVVGVLHAARKKRTDLAPSPTGSTVSERAALDFIDELVPLSRSPDRVSSRSDDEVAAHDHGPLDWPKNGVLQVQ